MNTDKLKRTSNIELPIPTTAGVSGNVEGFELPDQLESVEFRAAWGEWLAHRKVQRGGVELSERRRKAELSRVVNWPAAMAVEGIRHSIRFGYREIWPASVRGIPAKEQVWMRKEAARKLRAAVRRMEGCPKGGKLEDQYLQIMEVLHAES